MCEAVRQAVERHISDLERQGDSDFPYHFNARHAEAACDFFPLVLRHSIGDYAGMAFELEPWQAFAIWCIFGWKCDTDNSRRFRKFYWSMGRKNGKSTLAAGLALYLALLDVNPNTGKPEDVAEVILSATKKEQVEKVIYAEIERMRLRSKYIEQATDRINKQITVKANGGSIRCVGSDKPYDGLNPHAVLMDELHAWREHHRKFYDTMQTGSGSRCQPLIGTVTTAGDDQSHLWREEYEYCKGLLSGAITDERIFAAIYELDEDDDPLDESNWVKSNPNLGISLKIDFLRQLANEAAHSALALNRFTRYHGNRLVSSTARAFDLHEWDKAAGELSDWKDATAVGAGFDLGSRDDLAAYGLVAKFFHSKDEKGNIIYRYEVAAQGYIADSTERDLEKQPFARFVAGGQLKVEKYPIEQLKNDLIEDCSTHHAAVAYDPYNAIHLSEELQKEGITAARMAQNKMNQNEPIRDFMAALKDGRITHSGDPLLRWCVGNAVLESDSQDHWQFDKGASEEKIDLLVAVVMAFRMCCVARERARGSLYI